MDFKEKHPISVARKIMVERYEVLQKLNSGSKKIRV